MQLLILRLQKRGLSWEAFWRRHVYLLWTTGQMVESQDLHLTSRETHRSPIPYLLKTTAFVTSALTVAGGSWYVAVNQTTASDLTAIYNCSAFFAYAFSIPLLKEKLRLDKVLSVGVAIVGVLIVAYGDGDEDDGTGKDEGRHGATRLVGNLIIGVGSVLYGLYEVLYKRYACPPEGTSAGRSMIFANTYGSLIGLFTLLVLWIPLPVLHILGLETFRWPTGEAAWMLIISVIANASEFPPFHTRTPIPIATLEGRFLYPAPRFRYHSVKIPDAINRVLTVRLFYPFVTAFSGSFLVLISLTSPVLSSVAALLTIFLVAIVDWLRTGHPLAKSSIAGGVLIMVAFFLLSWSTYREMNEERKKNIEQDAASSDTDE